MHRRGRRERREARYEVLGAGGQVKPHLILPSPQHQATSHFEFSALSAFSAVKLFVLRTFVAVDFVVNG